MYQDGIPVFTSHNLAAAQESIHYPLSQIKNPENILLVSAEGGAMAEVEKHRPVSVDFVEIDPEITKVLFRFRLMKKIPGLNIINQDARAWLTETARLYDAVIVNLPEPETFQINRIFTDRFFELTRTHLTSGGVLSFSVEGYENYIAEPLRRKVSSLYNTVSRYFRYYVLLPGKKIFFLCSNRKLETDIPRLLSEKGIDAWYVNNFFYGNLTAERISSLNRALLPDAPLNLDEKPQRRR
ncbi:MAG TPA: hypothetical protein EYP57_04095 [Thermodesulfobacteriaceae bacterium]|nr:hypothetical protein [Thermodesulfobacteriaceae bacterium]